MKRFTLLNILLPLFLWNGNAQVINQNQQSVNLNLPVIEKPVYITKYRTVYVEKPRVRKALSAPVVLLDYLTVFPRDLGFYDNHPNSIISNINKQSLYGKNNWRLPTAEELKLMESFADEIGLGDDIYMASCHANGQVRLVSTGANSVSTEELIKSNCAYRFNNLLWSACNGLIDPSNKSEVYAQGVLYGRFNNRVNIPKDRVDGPTVELGVKMTLSQFEKSQIPAGWRLPTKQEFLQMLSDSEHITALLVGGNYAYVLVTNDDIGHTLPLNITTYPSRFHAGATTMEVYAYYLVQEGVVKIEWSRPVDTSSPDGYWRLTTLMEGDAMKLLIDEYTEFTPSWSQLAYVRLVRDL